MDFLSLKRMALARSAEALARLARDLPASLETHPDQEIDAPWLTEAFARL